MNVPERVVTNDYFESYLDTSDEWIQERTGIRERRWADGEISASELALPACRAAIRNAGLSESDIDGIIFATVTPDYIFPSTACILQGKLGIKKGFAFDVNAVCSGFVYALVMADSLIRTGQCSNVLIVGSELYSRIIDQRDRSTCILFGDGAGAAVLSKSAAYSYGSRCDADEMSLVGSGVRGILGSELHSDGSCAELLCVRAGTAKTVTPESLSNGEHYLFMAGREIFKLAVRALVEVSESLLKKYGVDVSQIDYFVSHQANRRILLSMAKQLGISEEKVLINVDKYGNTSAASLPILLAESAANGVLKKGDLILLSAFGGGVTWGVVLLRW
ncbi:MAG: ketoacyl-ACP synthase III [Deltaproteobacteria bacterium]|nr:ketoacyl-ACP synthase III [Deltaproteobacteria bacterium]